MYNPKIKHKHSALILLHVLYFVFLLFFLANITIADAYENNDYRPRPSTPHRVTDIRNTTDISSKLARVTAFSAVEFCATNYARKTYPNCNGKTFPQPAVAIRSDWLKQGVVAVYIPDFDQEYGVIGRTDGKTEVDIWTGADHAAALNIGNKIREIELIY